jgi:DnaJ-class molecular chaperone
MRQMTKKELTEYLRKTRERRLKIQKEHEQRMLKSGYIKCPECGGEGLCEYERAVVDWNDGGYLEGYTDTCDTCEGEGYIEDD